MPAKFFITTAIDYVNGRPHLGHAYEKILADVIHRYRLSLGEDSYFITGVDEHGQKVQQSAQAHHIEPQEFCDTMSAHFRELWGRLQIDYDRFVRTTDAHHKTVVRQFLQQLHDKGEIYFREHEGFYSTRQEQFVTEKEMVDGQWPEIYGEVVPTKEPNYFFRLSAYQDWLRDYLQTHPAFIAPGFRRNEVLAALERPLHDLCISRPKSRLAWGIPLPFDEDYVTYVWFDALVNYVSFAQDQAGGNRWPADVHVMGKDILIPAHAVYWPIMLQALGLPQPRQLAVHGWWMNRGAKMSKSVGNVVDPVPYLEVYGADALRYFMMREMVFGQDADFSDEKFAQRYASDLANDLGNLVQRSLSMLHRYRGGIVPAVSAAADSELLEEDRGLRSEKFVEDYREAMEKFLTSHALSGVWQLIQRANQYVEQNAPWKLAKDPTQAARLDLVLFHLVETIRRVAILLAPTLPGTSGRIFGQLNLPPAPVPLAQAAFGFSLAGQAIGIPQPLFPRLEPAT